MAAGVLFNMTLICSLRTYYRVHRVEAARKEHVLGGVVGRGT